MLILAGITIASLTGENGLISKVKKASENSIEAENYQNEIMNGYEKEIEKYIDGEKYIIGSYEILGYNKETEKLKIIITITSNEPIENIVYPEGDKLICNGKTTVGIDYEIIDGEEYVFIVGKGEKQEKYLIQTKGFTKNEKSYIENAKDLVELRTIVNIGFTLENKEIQVVNDIDLKEVCYEVDGTVENDKSWTPIGNETTYFQGYFKGQGHIINNIYINSNEDYQGLFGYIGDKAIVESITIGKTTMKTSNKFLGSIVGVNYGMIQNCTNYADLEITGSNGWACGGITALNGGIIYRCKNYGTIKSLNEAAGGIVGYNGSYSMVGFIIESINNGNVTASDVCSGGITAENGTHGTDSVGYIVNCYNTGTISGGKLARGGIVGAIRYIGKATYIYNCYNRGNTNGGADIVGVDENSNGGKFVALNNYGATDATIEKLNVKSDVEQELIDIGLYNNNVWVMKDGVIALSWE